MLLSMRDRFLDGFGREGESDGLVFQFVLQLQRKLQAAVAAVSRKPRALIGLVDDMPPCKLGPSK